MHEVLNGYVEREELPGFVTLVGRRGQVHVDCVGYERDAIFRIASMSKPVAAVAALAMVEDGVIRLDDPVERWVPELAHPRVLRAIDGAVDDTVPAVRSITVRDLLTFTLGTGMVFAMPGTYPIQGSLDGAGLHAGNRRQRSADEYLRRLAALPLVHQPGEVWMYNTGYDVLGILLARAAGTSLGELMRERIFEPLNMRDTGFHVPAGQLSRLPTAYVPDPSAGLELGDEAGAESEFSRPPAFETAAGGLVSTTDDWLSFARMLLNHGTLDGRRILARTTVEAMTADQLTTEQKARSPWIPGYWQNHGWGWGVMVVTRRYDGASTPGQYGWDGGFGTTWRSDPREELILALMTQVGMVSPEGPGIFRDFLTLAYAALE